MTGVAVDEREASVAAASMELSNHFDVVGWVSTLVLEVLDRTREVVLEVQVLVVEELPRGVREERVRHVERVLVRGTAQMVEDVVHV